MSIASDQDDLATLPGEAETAGIDTTTLAQQVYLDLESRILGGELLPGDRVSLRGLAATLGTSMQPVREAVGRLVAVHALEVTPNRSLRVPPVDRATTDDIWAMRLLLEGEAAARFAERHQADEARSLFVHSKVMREIRYGVDLEPTMRAIMAWNQGLAVGSGSPLLIENIARLRLRYAPWLAMALSVPRAFEAPFLQFTLHIQDELVLALEAGDAAAARHLRCADLRSFQRYLYGRLDW
ncbi:GntR family transcriptional regulator [Arboricoccus pini]|nr:GntR family transcriptional regulator [Arboricoccus pini]